MAKGRVFAGRAAGAKGRRGLVAFVAMALAAALMLAVAGCGSTGTSTASGTATSTASSSVATASTASTAASTDEDSDEVDDSDVNAALLNADYEPPVIEGLTYESTMDLTYAKAFDVYYYSGGYKVIASHLDGRNYLIVPEGASVPGELDDSYSVLQQPLDNIYDAATSTPALFDAIDGLSAVTMLGTNTSGWNIDAPKEALESGAATFAGKYSQPDYEMMVENDCDLAIESTMILHTPEVQEMIEDLGIPVFVERSSYEPNPMGRTEWVKVYGAMLNKEDAASEFFDEQVASIEDLQDFENTGKTVAFIAVNTDGSVVIRKSGDYIAKSIDIAGGVYAFADIAQQGTGTTMRISMEQCYEYAKDADYIVYNSTIETALTSLDDLISKNETFADYKAVKEGNVFNVSSAMYQSTDKNALMIRDFNLLVTDGDESEMTFLSRVQ